MIRGTFANLTKGLNSMTRKSIGFHTRLYGQNSVKVTGGSFGGALDIDTANRLVSNHGFTVIVKPSGNPVFVDREGREVSLYFAIDPGATDKGKAALKADAIEREAVAREEERKREEIESLLDGMSPDAALALLKSRPKG